VGAGETAHIEAARREIAAVPAAAPAPWWHEAEPLGEAMIDFGAGRYAACAQRLLPLLPVAYGFGGSQAQRSLLFLTATEAARRAGDTALWEALSSELRARKPQRVRSERHPALKVA
jgi:hypothetical protein